MKRILTILLTCLTLALTTACNTKTKSSVNDHPVVVIKVKNYGDITVKLDRTQAPITVDNFISQFFIMQDDNTGLDGQYAAFGKVTKGMHVVDQIAWNTPVLDNNGTVAKDQQPVIESIRVKK